MEFNLNKRWHLNSLVYLTALLLTVTLAYFLFPVLEPLELTISSYKNRSGKDKVFYQDLNQDGFSERIEIKSSLLIPEYYLLVSDLLRDGRSGVNMDQYDLSGPVAHNWIFYRDFTEDGTDEIVVFNKVKDRLCLTVIDFREKQFILREHPMIGVTEPNPHHYWDFEVAGCQFLNIDEDVQDEIIFAIHSEKSRSPRGLYAFDLSTRSLVRSFETNAGISEIKIFDLNNDQIKEIVLYGKASGNIQHGPFNDQTNWLFVLDHNFKHLFQPKNYSEYPGDLNGDFMLIDGRAVFVFYINYKGARDIPNELVQLDQQGLNIRRKYFFKSPLSALFVDHLYNESELFLIFENGDIQVFDQEFKLIRHKKLEVRHIQLLNRSDLDRDGQEELVLAAENQLLILDKSLKTIGVLDVDERILEQASILKSGTDRREQVAIHTESRILQISTSKNLIYKYRLILFALLWQVNFLGLNLVQYFFRRAGIIIYFLNFSLKKSQNGLMILDPAGYVLYQNHAIQKYLNLGYTLKKHVSYKTVFKRQPEVETLIRRSIKRAERISTEISVLETDHRFSGTITIHPFQTKPGFLLAYLIEVHDLTKITFSEQIKTWAHTTQKMVHDIKQPLSSIALNLKTLQIHLENETIQNKAEIQDDLSLMRSELDRVRALTNSFLKFVNLDKPNIQYANLEKLIKTSLERFDSFRVNDIQIELEIGAKIDAVQVDEQQLTMVIHSIVENAIDAMHGHGRILVSAGAAQYPERAFTDYIQIEISDNGPGIPPEIRDKIFEPFITTKAYGTGMGLALGRKIMEDHHGFIDVVSRDGLGTTVILAIPARG